MQGSGMGGLALVFLGTGEEEAGTAMIQAHSFSSSFRLANMVSRWRGLEESAGKHKPEALGDPWVTWQGLEAPRLPVLVRNSECRPALLLPVPA